MTFLQWTRGTDFTGRHGLKIRENPYYPCPSVSHFTAIKSTSHYAFPVQCRLFARTGLAAGVTL